MTARKVTKKAEPQSIEPSLSPVTPAENAKDALFPIVDIGASAGELAATAAQDAIIGYPGHSLRVRKSANCPRQKTKFRNMLVRPGFLSAGQARITLRPQVQALMPYHYTLDWETHFA